MKLALSMEGELEDRMEAPDWYSSLTGEAKTEADSLLAQMGKVSVLVYGRYSQYDERMETRLWYSWRRIWRTGRMEAPAI